MRSPRLRLLAVAALLGATPFAVPATAASHPAAATKAEPVRVGTAVLDVSPATNDPQFLGGFENMTTPTATIHDPLQVRAFVVRRGSKTVAFAILDVQGWFAGYQEGPYGITDVREKFAQWLSTHGSPGAGPQDVIVSSTHSHAAPTIMGIWGRTDLRWLRRVHDSTITALEYAAITARPAELWTAEANVGEADGSTVAQTDIYDGWTIDGRVPLLWAREPGTGKTIGLYANVPIHADIVHGSAISAMSADHLGFTRTALDRMLGGTAVVAMGTLGRQESIVQVGGLEKSAQVAAFVTARIRTALAQAKPLLDPSLGGAEQHVLIPGTNPALLALIAEYPVNGPCIPGVNTCPIDRSLMAPYMYGNVIGSWITTLRIGDLLYVSEPGEAFPEVSAALRAAVPHARVRVVGMAQDQLGYYFPAEDLAFTTGPNTSDHLQFNSSGALADQSVQATAADAAALGFSSAFVHPSAGFVDPLARRNPGVQVFAAPADTPSLTTLLQVAWNRAITNSPLIDESSSPVKWDFGDGTTARSRGAISHTWRRPGRYRVTCAVADTAGGSRVSSIVVNVGTPYPPLPT